jgi:hypothetical protein
MNFFATLTDAEVAALSDCDMKLLRTAEQDLHRTFLLDPDFAESAFEIGLRVKNTLNALEAAPQEPFVRALPVFVNCEYQLWRLHEDIPLKNNPFLSHWVETLQLLDKRGNHHLLNGRDNHQLLEELDSSRRNAAPNLPSHEANAARMLWIKTLLQQNDLKRWLEYTPMEVYHELRTIDMSASFDLQPYIKMLEDEGIYERRGESQPVAPGPSTQHPEQEHKDDGPLTPPSPEDALQKQKDGILQMLNKQPESAIFALTRLPIAIPYLDFLTTLLADFTLEKYNIDPAPIVTQYIQHSLRSIERAERPASASSQPELGDYGRAEHNGGMEYGKDAQTQYIRLLLLFIKSLIRKGLVELDVLYYEIQEITVRYVWIKEVRDFKRWAEEGVE